MKQEAIKTIRCAIYTRKPTDEGLDKEFNTLEAQRESGINYIKSQAYQGWEALADHYDDGGFSGGNMNRPALKRLFEDIKAGKIDMIVVYKIDRLTRSLTDFSKMVELFDEYQVSFVSVTQNFNTYDSMGLLTLNKQLIVALVRAFGWQNKLDKGNLNIQELSELEQLERGYMGKIIKLTLLAPDIVESILAGLQPPNLTLISFLRSPIPVDWSEQRKKYGFSS